MLRAVFCGCYLLVSCADLAWAQTAGRLEGTVRDPDGHGVPGVTVTVTGDAVGTPRTTVTDNRGGYAFVALPPGRYLVEAAVAGFEPWRGEVEAGAGDVTLDIVLAVAPLFERLTVTATKTGAAEIQSTPIAITALSARTLEQLEIRNIERLVGFVPTLTISQHTGLAQVTIRGVGSNAVFAGSDPSTTIHLDGVYSRGRRWPSTISWTWSASRSCAVRRARSTGATPSAAPSTSSLASPPTLVETRARLTVGNYDTLRAEGAFSGPLIKDKVMGSVAILRSSRDGFVHDLDHPDHSLGSEDTWAGRGQVRVVLGPRSELLLSGDAGRFAGLPLHWSKPIAAKPGFTFDSPASLWTVRTSDVTRAGTRSRAYRPG